MNRVDKIFQENLALIMSQPWEEVKRPMYNDGTGVKVKRILQVCNQYDLRRGFPLGSIRPVYLKSAIKEILAIWQKRSCNLEDLGKIWEPWSYLDTSNKIVRVKPVIMNNTDTIRKNLRFSPIVDDTLELIKNTNGPDYYCLEKDYKNRKVKIQFSDTGLITWISMSGFHSKKVSNPYERTAAGIGYLGNYMRPEITDFFGEYLYKWKNQWEHLFKRCGKCKGYENIFVHESFHSLEDFLLWVKSEIIKRGDTSLLEKGCVDKDYYSSNCYSSSSCTILTHKENNSLKLDKFYVYRDNIVMYGLIDVARYLKSKGMDVTIWKDKVLSRKTIKIVKDFIETRSNDGSLKIIENKDNGEGFPRFRIKMDKFISKCYGYQMDKSTFGFDSQTDYILNEIKKDPSSRRMVTSMYYPDDNGDKSLLECAFSTIWSVREGYLYLTLIQRSQDFLTANLWNTAQYAALMMMFAHDAGLKPAIFTHFIQDCHLYDRHEEQANELLRRPLFFPIPQVTISTRMEGKGFYDFTPEDFEVWNYEPGKQLKFEVAI